MVALPAALGAEPRAEVSGATPASEGACGTADGEHSAMLQVRGPSGLPQSKLSEATLRCIEETMLSMTIEDATQSLRGKGETPATKCSVVPRAGFYRGFVGQTPRNAIASPLGMHLGGGTQEEDPADGWVWKGNHLKECTVMQDHKCGQRQMSNQIVTEVAPVAEQEALFGKWNIKEQSWVDGQPVANVVYPDDVFMRQAEQELRPWCLCNVRMYLGILLWSLPSGEIPIGSAVLIPPDAEENDCPAKHTNNAMCKE